MQFTYGQYRQAQAGFGIVEIMIALALGVIIMLGVTQIAANNSGIRHELDRSGRQIENAAFALREIESDLTNAGFWGEMGEQTDGQLLPVESRVCPTEYCSREDFETLNDPSCQLNWALRFPVQGGSADFDCGTLGTITPKVGTDYIAVRRANSCALGSPGCDAAEGNIHLQVHACFTPGVDTAPLPGIDYALDTITGAPDLSVFKYTQRGVDCLAAPAAPQYRLLNRIYYVNDDDQLVRAELVGTDYVQSTLVEGIELMRIEYGMDRDGDGQVDDDVNGYTTNPTTDLATNTPDAFPDDWADVVMARISLVVRNTGNYEDETGESGGFVDDKVYTVAGESYTVPTEFQNHRRQVYTRTVGLRNVAGRRED